MGQRPLVVQLFLTLVCFFTFSQIGIGYIGISIEESCEIYRDKHRGGYDLETRATLSHDGKVLFLFLRDYPEIPKFFDIDMKRFLPVEPFMHWDYGTDIRHPQWSPVSNKIVCFDIASDHSSRGSIYIMSFDIKGKGSAKKVHICNVEDLRADLSIKDVGKENSLNWSPDGKRIVFSHPRYGLGLINENHNILQLYPAGTSPKWSQDGKGIYYLNQGKLLYIDDSLKPAELVNADSFDISPDGTMVAYSFQGKGI